MSNVDGTGPTSEGSIRGTVVALVTPFLAIAASATAGWVAEHVPGAALDPAQITTMMVAVVVAVIGVALKWLHGWQHHEARVSAGTAQPVKVATGTPPPNELDAARHRPAA